MKNLTRNVLSLIGVTIFMVAKLTLIIGILISLLIIIVLNAISFSNNQSNYHRSKNYSKEATKFIAVNDGIGITNVPIGKAVLPYFIKPQQARFIAYDAHGNITNETFTETIWNPIYDHDKHLIYYESLDGFSVFDYLQRKVIKTIKHPFDQHYLLDKMGNRSIVDRLIVHNDELYFSQVRDVKNNAVYKLCQVETKKCFNLDGKLNHLVSTPAGMVAVSNKTFWLFDRNLNLLQREKIDNATQVYGVVATSQSYRIITNRKIANLPCMVLSRELAEEYQYNSSIWLRASFIARNQQIYAIVSKKDKEQKIGGKTALYVANITDDDQSQFKLIWEKNDVYHTPDMAMFNDKKLMFEFRYWNDDSDQKRNFLTYKFANHQTQEKTIEFTPINQQRIGYQFWMLD